MAVLLVTGCANSDGSFVCHAPAKTSYSCEPIDPATAPATACIGGPTWRSAHGPDDAPLTHEDPQLVFPAGCTFSLPECGCCYASGRVIECMGTSWVEPL